MPKRRIKAEDLYRFQLISGCELSPDGETVVFSLQRVDRKTEKRHSNLWIVPTRGGRPRKVETPFGEKGAPRYSPNGRHIAYYGRPGGVGRWVSTRLYAVPAAGSLEAHDLTGSYDIHPATGTIGDLGEQGIRSPLWDVDGERIYFQIARHGLTTLVSVDRANQNLETVIDTIDSVGDFCFDSEQSRVAYVASNFSNPARSRFKMWQRDRRGHSRGSTTRGCGTWIWESSRRFGSKERTRMICRDGSSSHPGSGRPGSILRFWRFTEAHSPSMGIE